MEAEKGDGMLTRGVGRARSVGLWVLTLPLWLVITGCAGQQEEGGGSQQEEQGPPPVAGSFVEEMPDVGERGGVRRRSGLAGEEGEEREVRAYLRDGREIMSGLLFREARIGGAG